MIRKIHARIEFFENEPFQTSSDVFTQSKSTCLMQSLRQTVETVECFAVEESNDVALSCDLCGIPLDDQRFVVQLEAYPAFDPDQLEAVDLDADHLQQVARRSWRRVRTTVRPA
ncbi:MAG: hypothetical protein U0872_08510 [Planctomycetaceae bacterium]